MISPGSRPATSRKRMTLASVGGTMGRPSVHPRSKYSSMASSTLSTSYCSDCSVSMLTMGTPPLSGKGYPTVLRRSRRATDLGDDHPHPAEVDDPAVTGVDVAVAVGGHPHGREVRARFGEDVLGRERGLRLGSVDAV